MYTITVIIPVYNAADFLEKAVESVVQFDEVKEILLIDDGSTDGSTQLGEQLAAKFECVKFLQHSDKKNHGVSATRNLGMDLATQEYITFLDADDYYLPNRFDAERELFKDPKIDGVFGALATEFISEKGREVYMKKFHTDGLTTVHKPGEGETVFLGLTETIKGWGTFFSMIALTVKRSVYEKYHLRLNENLKIGEDKEFIIKLAYYAYLKSGFIDKPVAMRTGHENNTITKAIGKVNFHHAALMYQSLYEWAVTEPSMDREIIKNFQRKYRYNKVSSENGLKKYFNYLRFVIADPTLLKTRYRYYMLK